MELTRLTPQLESEKQYNQLYIHKLFVIIMVMNNIISVNSGKCLQSRVFFSP